MLTKMLTKSDAPTTLLQVMGAMLDLFRFPSRLIHLILQCRDSLLEPLGHRCAHGSHILHELPASVRMYQNTTRGQRNTV